MQKALDAGKIVSILANNNNDQRSFPTTLKHGASLMDALFDNDCVTAACDVPSLEKVDLPAPTWDKDQTDSLKRLHASGIPYVEIAAEMTAEFACCFTKNICIGKANRLKLAQRIRRGQVRSMSRAPADAIPFEAPRVNPFPKPDPSLNCTLIELNEERCRFPIGEPGDDSFRYCGAPSPASRKHPYCTHCAFIAFIPDGGHE